MARNTQLFGGIILSGGRSARMGESKAWLPFGDEYLLQRVARIVGKVVGPLVVAGQTDQSLPPLQKDVMRVNDAMVDAGPLAGIAAGLAYLEGRCDAAFVVPCDHPLLKPAFIRLLMDKLGEAEAVVPEKGGRWYPLTALYRISTRARAERQLALGERRAASFARQCDPLLLTPDDFSSVDPGAESLLNINDPEEYRRVLATCI